MCFLLHQEREERTLRMRRQNPNDRPSYGYQSSQLADGYQAKRQKPNSRLPPGELYADYVLLARHGAC